MEKLEFEGEECYAILYTKVTLGVDYMVFVPVHVIEGLYNEKDGTVLDKFNNIYDNYTALDILVTSDPKVVGSVIYKEQLQEVFPGLSTEEALSAMLDTAYENLCIGIYEDKEEQIRVFFLNFEQLMGKKPDFLPVPLRQTGQKTTDGFTETEESLDWEMGDRLTMDIHTLQKIVEMDDAAEMKTTLKDILDFYYTVTANINPDEKDEGDYEDEEPKTIEDVLPIDKTDSTQVFGFDINWLEGELLKQIVNQDEAIEKVVCAIAMDQLAKRPFDKERILLCGPTGSGKTQIMRSLSELIKRPFVVVPTTQLTSAGYVGADIEDFFRELVRKADGDVDLAEQGILVLDELDKKASETGRNNDVAFRTVLNSLLPIFEDNTYEFTMERRNHNSGTVRFKTGRLTIVGSGSFEEILKKKRLARPIGFGGSVQSEGKNPEVTIEDMENGGVPIELLGRFPIIVWTNPHTEESLKQILTDSQLSPLLTEKEKVANYDVELRWDEAYLNACVKESMKKKTGARALKAMVEGSVGRAKMESARNLGVYEAIQLVEGSMTDSLETVMVLKDGNEKTLREVIEARQKVKKR